jgi:hypothetical protein
MSSQPNGRAGQPDGDRSRPPAVTIAIAVVVIVALGAGFAGAGVLAISRRHYEIIVMSSKRRWGLSRSAPGAARQSLSWEPRRCASVSGSWRSPSC